MKENSRLISGFTFRVMMIIILAAVVYVPVSTYTSLLLGAGFGGQQFFMTLLFVNLLWMLGQKLTKQESLMVYYAMAAVTGVGFSFVNLIIYRVYFIHSPFAWANKIGDSPLALLVPEWMAPPYGSSAYKTRNLFQLEFLPSITYYATFLVLSFIAELSLSMLISRVYVEEEKLPFPFATVDTSLVSFVSEREMGTTKLFIIGMAPGICYSTLVFLLPSIIGFQLIPLPYADLTPYIQNILPGSILAIPVVLAGYVGGFMAPFRAATFVFIVSSILNIFNSLFITTFPDVFPEWKEEYFLGMGAVAITQRVFARVWFAPNVGFMIGSALVLTIKSRRALITLFKGLFRPSEKSILGFPSPKILLALYLGSTLSSVAIFHYLIPEVPLWLPIFASVVLSLFVATASTASQGVVGYGIPSLPGFTWHTLLYITPYQGYAGFTAPPVIAGAGSSGFCQRVKACLLTDAKPTDLIKLSIFTSILTILIGLLCINYFWSIAPIPSAAYPSTVYGMPSTAVVDTMIVTRQLRVEIPYILVPAGIVIGIMTVGEILTKIGLPWSNYGFVLGLFMPWTAAFCLFIGSTISTFFMPLVVGKENWEEMKSKIVAGESLGEGIILTVSTILAIILKSGWMWPW